MNRRVKLAQASLFPKPKTLWRKMRNAQKAMVRMTTGQFYSAGRCLRPSQPTGMMEGLTVRNWTYQPDDSLGPTLEEAMLSAYEKITGKKYSLTKTNN